MNISLIISRLSADIQNPLLGNILWLLEDFSGVSTREDFELLNCNIVARVSAIMETLIRCLSNCYIDPCQQVLEPKTEHGMNLFNKCLVIMSNLSAQIPDARKEILKFKMLEMVTRSFQITLIQNSSETLKNLAWLMRNLTQKINKIHWKTKSFEFGVIMAALVQMLYVDDPHVHQLVIETFLHISESDNETFADEAMKYELTCDLSKGEKSLW